MCTHTLGKARHMHIILCNVLCTNLCAGFGKPMHATCSKNVVRSKHNHRMYCIEITTEL